MESKIICQGTEISRTWNASLPIPRPRAENPGKRATVTMAQVTFGHLAYLHILCTYWILGWLVQFCIFKSFQIQPIPASLCLEDMEGYGHVLRKDYNGMLCVSAFKTLLRAWLDWMCVTCHKEAKVAMQMQQIRPVIDCDRLSAKTQTEKLWPLTSWNSCVTGSFTNWSAERIDDKAPHRWFVVCWQPLTGEMEVKWNCQKKIVESHVQTTVGKTDDTWSRALMIIVSSMELWNSISLAWTKAEQWSPKLWWWVHDAYVVDKHLACKEEMSQRNKSIMWHLHLHK